MSMKQIYCSNQNVSIYLGDALDLYDKWERPNVIVSDGPYGISSFPGDPSSPNKLPEWYEPHIIEWSKHAKPAATLWFWNTEIGWAKTHPILEKHGWIYKNCNIWNKGLAHIAGNSNTKSLSQLPVVTEVCVQYVKEVKLQSRETKNLIQLKQWLREEWQATGTPLYKTNEVCGVKDAATRKYFTLSDLWYFPPPKAFKKLADYANLHGKESGKPYFSIDGKEPLTEDEWADLKPLFKCPVGTTNVWDESAVRGKERVKNGHKAVHINQKPLKLMERTIEITSNENDVVWEPFGGLCSAGIAASKLNRKSFCAEINPMFYEHAKNRLEGGIQQALLAG